MYSTYKGRVSEFRALDNRTRSRILREALNKHGSVQCLECDRPFTHHYGLMYHVERCNLDDSVKPWKCYRCGYLTTKQHSSEHLDKCWRGNELKTIKKEDEAHGYTENGITIVSNFTLRSGKQTSKEGTPVVNGGEEGSGLTDVVDTPTGRSTRGRKRNSKQASVSNGVIPTESSRVRISDSGKLRFRFRKAEITSTPTDICSWRKYMKTIQESADDFAKSSSKLILCPLLNEISTSDWTSDVKTESPIDVDKQSVKFNLHFSDIPCSSDDKFPMGCRQLKQYESISESDPDTSSSHISVAYAGGPIHTIRFAPNPLSKDEEVFVVGIYPDDEHLVSGSWKTDPSSVQLWIKKTISEQEPEQLEPWFTLGSDYGQILTATWLDRTRRADDKTLIGFLALGTAQGSTLIYRIDTTTMPRPKDNKVPYVVPKPVKVLIQEPPTTENEEVIYPPPITKLAWCTQGEGQYIAALNAAGKLVFWDLTGDVENPHVLMDPNWQSPAFDLCFGDGFMLALAFRERYIRVYDVLTWNCILVGGTVRTAGARIVSEPRILTGMLTFQSEYFASSDVPATGAAYISIDSGDQGYFVVPLANRHSLQTWDISVSTVNGMVASCGVDGQLQLGANGKMTSRLSTFDCGFSFLTTALALQKKRLQDPNAPTETPDGKPVLKEGVVTHEECLKQLYLDVYLGTAKLTNSIEYSSLEARIESLNAVSTSHHGRGGVVTGGQAGLLFCRPVAFTNEEDVLINSMKNMKKE